MFYERFIKEFHRKILSINIYILKLKKNDLAAAKYMRDIINDACDKLTTNLYDDI